MPLCSRKAPGAERFAVQEKSEIGNQLLGSLHVRPLKGLGSSEATLPVGRLLGQDVASKGLLGLQLPRSRLSKSLGRPSIGFQFWHTNLLLTTVLSPPPMRGVPVNKISPLALQPQKRTRIQGSEESMRRPRPVAPVFPSSDRAASGLAQGAQESGSSHNFCPRTWAPAPPCRIPSIPR